MSERHTCGGAHSAVAEPARRQLLAVCLPLRNPQFTKLTGRAVKHWSESVIRGARPSKVRHPDD